jgi:hypothetical protein
MTRLADLLEALTAVIIRYHDDQVPSDNKIIAAREFLIAKKYSCTILNNPQQQFKPILEDYIKKATTSYSVRKHLLAYFLHEITFIKELLDRKVALSKEEFNQCTGQLKQMFLDFQTLLWSLKTVTYEVTYGQLSKEKPPIKIALNGLLNPGKLYPSLCLSGQLLKEVLSIIHADERLSNEQLGKIAEEIAIEYHYSLLDEHANKLIRKQKETEELLRAEQLKTAKLTQQLIEQETAFNQKKVRDVSEEQESASNSESVNSKLIEALRLVEEQKEKIKEQALKITQLQMNPYNSLRLPLLYQPGRLLCSPLLFQFDSTKKHTETPKRIKNTTEDDLNTNEFCL